MFFVFRGHLFLCQQITRCAVDGIEADYILPAQTCNSASDVSFCARALTEITRYFRSQLGTAGFCHQLQGAANSGIGQDVQKRGLPQLHRNRLLQGVIEDGISGRIVEVGQHQGVLLVQLRGAVRAPVQTSGNDYRD